MQTASGVFCMLPEAERDAFEKAVAALGKHFKPKDIEELHGIEFHHIMQEIRASCSCGSLSSAWVGKLFPP